MTSADLWHEFAHDPRASAYASMRASDADRDLVLRALSEAYADGRLDPEEIDERSTGVQAARTRGELPAYLTDLVPADEHVSAVPVVRPLSTSRSRQRRSRAGGRAAARR